MERYMTEAWLEAAPEDEVGSGLAAIRSLAREAPLPAVVDAIVRRLLERGVLAEIAELASQQRTGIPPVVDPVLGPSGDEPRAVPAPWSGLPHPAALATRPRRQAIAAARERLRAELRPGLVALVADAGDRDARHILAEALREDFGSAMAGTVAVVDAVDDPALPALDRGSEHGAVVIIDGDVAPRLSELVAAGRSQQASIVIIVPGSAIRTLGEALEPDLVLGIPADAAAGVAAVAGTSELAAALELSPTGRQPLRLPAGEALANALWSFVTQAANQGADGGPAIIAACQRLSATVHRPIVRRVLANRWPLIQDRIPLTLPHHVLTWARLLSDLGLRDESPKERPEIARDVLERGVAAFPDDLRLRHALLALRMKEHPPTPNELTDLAETARQLRQTAGGRASASYFAHVLARAQRRAGDLPAAAATIEAALTDDPDNVVLLIEAGLIASRLTRWQQVETRFRAAHLIAPRSGVVLNAWGRAAALGGDPERAERLLERAAALEPWNARHHLELAQLAKDRGLLQEAEERLLSLLDDPEPATARRVRVELADTLIEAGAARWNDAEAVFADIGLLDDDPGAADQARLIGLRVKLLAARGEHAAAEDLATTLPAARSARLLAQEATAILDRGDPARVQLAEDRLTRLRALPDYQADPATRRVAAALAARAWLLRGDLTQARTIIDRELASSPPLPILLNTRAAIEDAAAARANDTHAGQWLREQAETWRRMALDADPRNAYTHRALAHGLTAGRAAEARQHLRYVRLAGLAMSPPGPHGQAR